MATPSSKSTRVAVDANFLFDLASGSEMALETLEVNTMPTQRQKPLASKPCRGSAHEKAEDFRCRFRGPRS
jgi:hypothetical protein